MMTLISCNNGRLKSVNRTLLILCALTLYISLSGFDCASTEMTTAKVALSAKDDKKAEEFLKKELAARPQNAEAWTLLGDLYGKQKRYLEMNDAYTKAESGTMNPAKPEAKENFAINRFNAWLDSYNAAGRSINHQEWKQALGQLDTALALRPGNAETIARKAVAYSSSKDEANAMSAYQQYVDIVRKDVTDGIASGLSLGLSPAQTSGKLGTPTKQMFQKDSSSGFMYYSSSNLYVYFVEETNNDSKRIRLDGWKYYDTKTQMPTVLKEIPVSLSSIPFYNLGVAAYQEAEKTKNQSRYSAALDHLRMVAKFDPMSYPKIGQLVSEIYVKSGRESEARALFEQEIAQHPNDPMNYINYGNFLFNKQDIYGAIDKFKKALSNTSDMKSEPAQLALFNLGAAYKNIGAIKQDSIAKVSNNKPTKAQVEVFYEPLRKSMDYFEQLRTAKSEMDFSVIKEIGNLYYVLAQPAKLKKLISEMEGLRGQYETNKEYWGTMEGLYAANGDVAKANDAHSKSQ